MTSLLLHQELKKDNPSLEMIKKFIIQDKADVNSYDKDGETTLTNMCLYSADKEIIKYLVDAKADLNKKNKNKFTPLICSFKKQDDDLIKMLIDLKANPNLSDDKTFQSALEVYLLSRKVIDIEMIKYMVEKGGLILNDNHHATTALLMNENVDVKILDYLLDKKVNVRTVVKGECPIGFYLGLIKEKANVEVVKMLYEKGKSPINVRNSDGHLPIHTVANHCNYDMLKYFVEIKQNLNEKDSKGLTLLHSLFRNPHVSLDSVKLLVENKAQINSLDDQKNTPLIFSCFYPYGTLEIVKYLVEKGADVKLKSKQGLNALTYAARNEKEVKPKLDIVKYFVNECGMKVNEKQTFGTLLHYVCFSERIDMDLLKYIIEEAGGDVNIKNSEEFNPLAAACINKNPDINVIKYLFEKKGNINNRDGFGENCLYKSLVKLNTNSEVIKFLIDNGADPNMIAKREGYSPFLVTVEKFEFMDYLVNNTKVKVDFSVKNNEGENAFINAFTRNVGKGYNFEMIKYLVEKLKFNVNSHNNKKYNAIHIMCARQELNVEIIDYLVEQKIDCNFKSEAGFTPLTTCINSVKEVNFEVVKLLIEKGKADPNSQDKRGFSTLYYACSHPFIKLEAIEYLLKSKANPNLKSFDNKVDCIDVAKHKKNLPLVELLTSYSGSGVDDKDSWKILSLSDEKNKMLNF